MNEIDVLIKTKADTSGVKEATEATDKYGNKLEATGEQAGAAETRLIGIHDVIDGTATVMQGPGQQGMVAYIQGWADIAGGVEGVLPLLKAMSIEAIKSAATQVAQAARTVGAWIAMRATAVASAAQMAAAWVVSLGPIALIVGGLALLGGALAVLWVKSQTFRNIVKGAWDDVWGAVKAVWDLITGAGRLFETAIGAAKKLAGYLTGPFVSAWHAVSGAIADTVGWLDNLIAKTLGYNKTQAKFLSGQASGGGSLPGVGGNKASPHFAHGGVTPGGAIDVGEYGRERIELPAGARVNPDRNAGGWGGPVTVTLDLRGDDTEVVNFVRAMIQKGVRWQAGGSVQRYMGYA